MVWRQKSKNYLTVASYNIHRCIGKDGYCNPNRIAAVLKGLNATIIGLQEVDSARQDGNGLSQIDSFSQSLGFKVVDGPTIHRPNGYYGNALLTRHEIRSIRQIDLSVPGREPRGALEVELNADGQRVHVIVTHFGLTGSERRVQVTRLSEAIAMDRDHATIVLGDFNEWVWWAPTSRCLNFTFGRSTTLRTFPSRFPLFSLDRVFVRPSDALIRTEVYATPLSRKASDHLPIKALIKIKESVI
jgi:endonuclease/exonuclease/phosphatase family metal-dependent hydrolase